jgi:hypothetical protein
MQVGTDSIGIWTALLTQGLQVVAANAVTVAKEARKNKPAVMWSLSSSLEAAQKSSRV